MTHLSVYYVVSLVYASFLVFLFGSDRESSPSTGLLFLRIAVCGMFAYTAADYLFFLTTEPIIRLVAERSATVAGLLTAIGATTYLHILSKRKTTGRIDLIIRLYVTCGILLLFLAIFPGFFRQNVSASDPYPPLNHLGSLYYFFLIIGFLVACYGFLVSRRNRAASTRYQRLFLGFVLFAMAAIIFDITPYYFFHWRTYEILGPLSGLYFGYQLYHSALNEDYLSLRGNLVTISLTFLALLTASTLYNPVLQRTAAIKICLTTLIMILWFDVWYKNSQARSTLDQARGAYSVLQQEHTQTVDYLSDIAHRLKAPLAIIEMNLVEAQNNHSDDALTRATEITQNALHTMRNLLKAGRIDQGRLHVQLKLVDLGAILQNWKQELEGLAPDHIICVTSSSSPIEVKIDLALFRDVIYSLVDNARKHSPTGSHIFVKSEETKGYALVQIVDAGDGIPPTDLPNVFEKHFQGRGSRHRQDGSAGLGLALAKWTIAKHGGSISISSKVGQGTTVTIKLPSKDRALSVDKKIRGINTISRS